MYRAYTSNFRPIETLPIAKCLDELHIAVAFARDYDEHGNYRVGKFFPYFDTQSLNRKAILFFKERAASMNIRAKFFLSIGGRDSRFPFAVTPAQEAAWIKNATDSLKKLLSEYPSIDGITCFDGIDVYYEHINRDAVPQFVKAIPKVIENLKNDSAITAASITVSAPLCTIYFNLYKANEILFDHVVYQTHTEPRPIYSSRDLLLAIEKLPYPKEKTLAGYSDDPHDWSTVPPPVFLFAVPWLLDVGLYGISKWIVTGYNPEA